MKVISKPRSFFSEAIFSREISALSKGKNSVYCNALRQLADLRQLGQCTLWQFLVEKDLLYNIISRDLFSLIVMSDGQSAMALSSEA